MQAVIVDIAALVLQQSFEIAAGSRVEILGAEEAGMPRYGIVTEVSDTEKPVKFSVQTSAGVIVCTENRLRNLGTPSALPGGIEELDLNHEVARVVRCLLENSEYAVHYVTEWPPEDTTVEQTTVWLKRFNLAPSVNSVLFGHSVAEALTVAAGMGFKTAVVIQRIDELRKVAAVFYNTDRSAPCATEEHF